MNEIRMLGIRAEDKNHWERRSPLTPDHIAELGEHSDLRFVVQPSPHRAFPTLDYTHAGAEIRPSVEDCRIVFGIKEIPVDKIEDNRVYLFFSHTAKGQSHNMPLLRRLLESRSTLIDYEYIVDEREKRLIFFGQHAGYAGMINSLWALGKRFEYEGLTTPFRDIRLAHDYSNLDEATHHISRVGETLRHNGLEMSQQPIVCGFTGHGNVSRGAQEVYDRLPTLEIAPEDLATLVTNDRLSRKTVHKVVFERKHRVRRKEDGGYDADEFSEHPDRYESRMPEWLPHLTMLCHGSFWSPDQPRIVSVDDVKSLWSGDAPSLRVIADISCDIGGGIETTVEATEPGDPVFVYDPENGGIRHGVEGRGPIMMTVDNLPCQLPVESSQHFGDTLVRFVPLLARCDWSRAWSELELPTSLRNAIITHRGSLTKPFAFLGEYLDA
ncbi:MAG: hypothetical protein OES25_09755 [Acidobacteriota bacterium]|nr:hypothetical protein [Acidobacteriota bacterium]